jgi:hypothetical protein
MNTCICFISRFTCFTLLAVHFLWKPQWCFDTTRFGGGYNLSFAPPPISRGALLHQKSYPAVRSPEAVSLENLIELASFTWKSSIGEHPLVE